MRKSIYILMLLCLFAPASFADRIGALNSEPDGTPNEEYAYKYIFPNGSLSITNGVATVSIVLLTTPATASTSDTLTEAEINGGIIVMTGDGTTLTLPAITTSMIGKYVSFYVDDATAKHVDTNAADYIVWLGTDLDTGDKLSIAAANEGKMVTLICLDADRWLAKGDLEWTDGG